MLHLNSLLQVDLELQQPVVLDRQHQPTHSVNNLPPRHSVLNPLEECLELPQLPIPDLDSLQVDSDNLAQEEECLVNPLNNPHQPVSDNPLNLVDYSANLPKHPLQVEDCLETHRLDSALNQLNPLLPIHSDLSELLNPLRLVSELQQLEDSDLEPLPTPLARHLLLELDRPSVDSAPPRINSKLLLVVDCSVEVDSDKTTSSNNLLPLLVDYSGSPLNSLLNPLLVVCLELLHPSQEDSLEVPLRLLLLAPLPDLVSLPLGSIGMLC